MQEIPDSNPGYLQIYSMYEKAFSESLENSSSEAKVG